MIDCPPTALWSFGILLWHGLSTLAISVVLARPLATSMSDSAKMDGNAGNLPSVPLHQLSPLQVFAQTARKSQGHAKRNANATSILNEGVITPGINGQIAQDAWEKNLMATTSLRGKIGGTPSQSLRQRMAAYYGFQNCQKGGKKSHRHCGTWWRRFMNSNQSLLDRRGSPWTIVKEPNLQTTVSTKWLPN